MANLSVGEAIREGVGRSVQRNGGVMVALFFLVSLIGSAPDIFGPDITTNAGLAAVSTGYLAMAAAVSVVSLVISLYIGIVAVRLFVSDETRAVPNRFLRDNIGFAMIHVIIGTFLVLVAFLAVIGATMIPAVLGVPLVSTVLLLPALVLLAYAGLGILFWNTFVAVEDETAMTGIKQSWQVADGNRWHLLLLVLGLAALFIGLSILFGSVTIALQSFAPLWIVEVVNLLFSAYLAVLSTAVVARAYVQMVG